MLMMSSSPRDTDMYLKNTYKAKEDIMITDATNYKDHLFAVQVMVGKLVFKVGAATTVK